MEHKVEKSEKTKAKFTVKVSAREMAEYFNKAYEKIAIGIKISGFRPGKAPRKLIEEAAGINRILSEALDMAVSEGYYQAIISEKISPIGQPNIAINKYPNYGTKEDEVKEYFEFEAEIEVMPKVELSDYSKLKIEKPEKKKADADEVTKIINQLQKRGADIKEIERTAKMGDQVEVSYEGSINHVKKDAMSSKNHPIVIGEKTLIPGFEEQLVGLKKGDKKEIKLKFPKDYHAKEFAGKDAVFNVEVSVVREAILPELNNEFAKRFGHDDMAALKKAIRESLEKEMEFGYQRELEGKVIEKVLPLLKTDVPEGLINREVERMLIDFEGQVKKSGLSFEQYLINIKKTRANIAEEMKPQAEKNVKIGFLLGKIIEEQKWKTDDPDAGRHAVDYLVKKLTK